MFNNKRKPLYVPEVAQSLRRSEASIRKMVARGQIPYRLRAGRIYFFSDELEEWLDSAPSVRLEDFKKS